MKIVILTLGTHGDVQPYAVLGQALKQRGHEVLLSTGKNFEELVRSYGIDFVPVQTDYQAILNSNEGKKMLKANPFVIKNNLEKLIYPLVLESLSQFYTLARESDKVIYHIKTIADSFADQFPEKMIRAMVVPAVQPTSAFANPAFSGYRLPSFFNWITYKMTDLAIKMMSKPINRFRMNYSLSEKITQAEIPFIYGISPLLLKKPLDYPGNSYFTGFWYGASPQQLNSDLNEFLQQGEPPLVITFGSMPFKCKFDLQNTLIRISNEFSIRIIVVKGWGFSDVAALEKHPSIKVTPFAPYDKLFPMVKAIIHHGGIGTTAECLRAGRPFFICPVLYPIGDQMFWGQLSYKKGVALKPVPLKKLTEKILIDKTWELLANEQLYRNSESFSKQLKLEDGVLNAIKIIEQIGRG
jgi:sterol 3beta-glucosyltransferase